MSKTIKIKKLTVTIGIPAYNEEANIRRMLMNIMLQKTDNFILRDIIVISDGSTDNTVDEVKKIKNNKIFIVDNNIRAGLNPTQNQILKNTNSDILVILNADTIPAGNLFLVDLIKPFYENNKTGIVGASVKSLNCNTFASKALSNSSDLKELIAQKINHSNNVYLCHGHARAFSKAFYKKLKWPYDCPEDSYSYFKCLEKGFGFICSKDAVVNFSMSSNIKDHIMQSKRFFNGKKALEKYFYSEEIKSGYRIPLLLFVFYLMRFVIKKPILTIGYIFIMLYIYVLAKNINIDHSKFEISKSSKNMKELICLIVY